MMSKSEGSSLADLITSVVADLKAAQAKSDDDAVLALAGCELELAVSVGGEANTGIKFWVLNAGAKVKADTVSKIKLSFSPLKENGVLFNQNDPSNKGQPIQKNPRDHGDGDT